MSSPGDKVTRRATSFDPRVLSTSKQSAKAPPRRAASAEIPSPPTKITPEMILSRAEDILREVDESPIFAVEKKRDFPLFSYKEVKFGKVLGEGGFGVAREVASVRCRSDKSEAPTLTSDDAPVKRTSFRDDTERTTGVMEDKSTYSDPAADDDAHYDVNMAKLIMARRVTRNGDARYAVKYLMKPDLTELELAQGRIDLAIEVKYLQAMNHPNIVRLRGVYDTNDPLHLNYFFLMDRLYGTLEERLGEWKEEVKKYKGGLFKRGEEKLLKELLVDRLVVGLDVSNAVRYMHSHQLLYRDMKPENIGFDIRGDVKIFDFGLAKALHESQRDSEGLYRLTSRTGSFPYMAPEVVKMEPYGKGCDVFSFGIMFWEVMALKKPFPKLETRRQYYNAITVKGTRPSISRKWPTCTQQLIKSSWDPQPSKRPTMDFIYETLENELKSTQGADSMHIDNRTQFLAQKSMKSLRGSLMRKGGRFSMIFGGRSDELT